MSDTTYVSEPLPVEIYSTIRFLREKPVVPFSYDRDAPWGEITPKNISTKKVFKIVKPIKLFI